MSRMSCLETDQDIFKSLKISSDIPSQLQNVYHQRSTVLDWSTETPAYPIKLFKDLQTFSMTVMYKLPQLVQRKASKKAQWF